MVEVLATCARSKALDEQRSESSVSCEACTLPGWLVGWLAGWCCLEQPLARRCGCLGPGKPLTLTARVAERRRPVARALEQNL
jgi:hypothetical protein